MRQSTGSMICPGCGKLIGVAEEKCPFCGAWNPSFYGYGPALQKLVGQRLDFIQIIVFACIGLYVASLVLQPEAIFQFSFPFGILQPGQRALFQLGMTGRLAWEQGWWWTVFTAIYLHGGLLHILFNVLWIRDLGPWPKMVGATRSCLPAFSPASKRSARSGCSVVRWTTPRTRKNCGSWLRCSSV